MTTDPKTDAGWYFAEQGRQQGPVSPGEFAQCVQNGRIREDTLVWHEGLEAWKPYREVAPPPAAARGPEAGAPAADGPAACTVCGQAFEPAQMLRFQDAWVCAGCKPQFVEQLKEEAAVPQNLRFGGFWIRAAAFIIDNIITSVVVYAVYIPVMVGMSAAKTPEGVSLAVQLLLSLFSVLVAGGYEIWMVGRYGATVGKMACGLRVVTTEGEKVTYARATGRYFAKMLSGIICYIGYLMVAFDAREKKGLHDLICNTRVVRA